MAQAYSAAMERVVAARMRLVRDHVFFGALAMRLRLVESDTLPALAGTDGFDIRFRPEIVNLPGRQIEGVLAHETMHVVLQHHYRMLGKHQMKANIAGDLAINPLILENRLELPEGALIDPQFANMTMGEIYDRLPDPPSRPQGSGQQPQGSGKQSPGSGQQPPSQPQEKGQQGFDVVFEPPNAAPSQSELKAEAEMMKAAVQNAAALARKAGQMTAGLERFVAALCAPKADWRAELADILTQRAQVDYDWGMPHKRMLHQYGIFFPEMGGYKIGKIGIINDTSGSTSQHQEQFASEISDILDQFECEITVFNHDTTTKSIEEYSSDDLPIKLRTVGYGGTCAKHTFDLINAEYDFDILVWLTDLEMNLEKITPPACPVIVACCERRMIKEAPAWVTRTIDIT